MGWHEDSSEIERYNQVGEVGYSKPQKSDTPHTKRIHRSGVSAEVITSSGLTAEQTTFLEIDFEDGIVTAHEGRHRMVMLRDTGVEKVAIVVKDIDSERVKYRTKKMTNVSVTGQEFSIGTAPGKVTIREIIHLSPNYRNEVREKFVDTSSNIRYSLDDYETLDLLEMWKVLQGENTKYAITSDIEGKRTIFKTFADVTGALATISEPLLELSVFSGINSLVESAQYSDSEAVLAMVSDMATSYLLQALPTMGGQISRMIDRNKREYYYTDKNSNIPKGIQRFLGQTSSKIPF